MLDRSHSFGAQGGPVSVEIRAALYDYASVPIKDYIYGLGGRDISNDHIESAFEDLKKLISSGKSSDEIAFLGVRE